jgi:hypothetical protein
VDSRSGGIACIAGAEKARVAGCRMFVFGVDNGRGVCLVDVDDAQVGIQVSEVEKESLELVRERLVRARDEKYWEVGQVCLRG